MRWDVVKSLALRTAVSAVLAGLAYGADHVTDMGASADNAALITFGLTYVMHFVHALATKYGVDPAVDRA